MRFKTKLRARLGAIRGLNQQNAVKNALKAYGIALPVIFNMNFGHTDPQMIIPNGGNVKIDCAAKTIEFH